MLLRINNDRPNGGNSLWGMITPPALAKNFRDTNADARSVCGS